MKNLLTPISFLLLTFASLAHADRLVFLNGDRVGGTLEGRDDTGHFLWKTAPGTPAIRIPPTTVHKITLSREEKEPVANHDLALTLTNGDDLHGHLLSLGEDFVDVESDAFAALQVPRTMIRGLNVTEGGYYILAAPGNAKEWFANNKGVWRVKDRVLRSKRRGTIGRDLPKAARIKLDFEYSTDDSGSGLSVHFFCADPKNPEESTHYTIQINGSYVYARKVLRQENGNGVFGRRINQHTTPLGDPVRLEQRIGSTPIRVTILADARSGLIILKINGKAVQKWNDPNGLGDAYGSGIGFTNHSDSNAVIRNLTVARWNGETALDEENAASTGDTVHLRNDDVFEGTVTGLKDNLFTVDTEHFGSLLLPTDRVLRIHLGTDSFEQARRMAGDVRVTFRSGGELTLQMRSLDKHHLTGYSENFGEGQLTLNALREIEFNLYAEKYPDPEALTDGNLETLLNGRW